MELRNPDPPAHREQLFLTAFHAFFGRTLLQLLELSGLGHGATFANIEAVIQQQDHELFAEYQFLSRQLAPELQLHVCHPCVLP